MRYRLNHWSPIYARRSIIELEVHPQSTMAREPRGSMRHDRQDEIWKLFPDGRRLTGMTDGSPATVRLQRSAPSGTVPVDTDDMDRATCVRLCTPSFRMIWRT